MIEFFGFYTSGRFVSIFIHFIGIAWFFILGAQITNWSNVINQLTAYNLPTQPFVLIFPFMIVVSLSGLLDSIAALFTENRGGETRTRIIAKRNSNRGL